MEHKIIELEARLQAIEERNLRVEIEKAWELSKTRKFFIIVLTYLVMCLVFWSLDNRNFCLNAIVPTLGFYLSTLSLPAIKKLWLAEQAK